MVYFIGNKEHKFVKIGYSDSPSSRMKDLQHSNPFELTLFREVQGDMALEHFFHRKFRDFHLRGEWFTLSPEIQAVIDRPMTLLEIIHENKQHLIDEIKRPQDTNKQRKVRV